MTKSQRKTVERLKAEHMALLPSAEPAFRLRSGANTVTLESGVHLEDSDGDITEAINWLTTHTVDARGRCV